MERKQRIFDAVTELSERLELISSEFSLYSRKSSLSAYVTDSFNVSFSVDNEEYDIPEKALKLQMERGKI